MKAAGILILSVAAGLTLLAPRPLLAQAAEQPPATANPIPPDAVPDAKAKRAETLTILFARLKQAEGPETARPIEAAILALLAQSDSPSIDLLMTRAAILQKEDDLEGSTALYRTVTETEPAFAAGWSRLGIAEALAGERAKARDDLHRALALEPRDIAALIALGSLLDQTGDPKGALNAYRRVLALAPHVGDIAARADRLEITIEGRGI